MPSPRVDFYVLPSQEPSARLRFACRLVEKAWLKRHRVRVQCEPGGELEALDHLLWTWSDRSFLPHHRGVLWMTCSVSPLGRSRVSSG